MVDDMRIISWNVNGIRAIAKKGQLHTMFKEGPDIICVQETKAWPEQLKEDLLKPSGYNSFWDQADKKGYSGTAIFTKRKPVNNSTGLGAEEFDSEGRTVWLEFSEFTLFNIYFPNGRRDAGRLKYKMDFYDAFLEKIDALRKQNKKIIFCGDLNTAHHSIDLARPKENEHLSGFLPIERKWMDKAVDHGYIDTFRHFSDEPDMYTWWDYYTRARERNVGWRLDYFFISDDLIPNLKNAFIMSEVMGSDHCPVGIDIEF